MSSSIEMNVEMSNVVTVNSLLVKSLESATREYARMCVSRLASEYGFSTEEALRILNLENLKLQVQEMKKRSGGKAKAKTEKTEKKAEKKVEKALYPLPFTKGNVSETGCQGLAYNGGLFTQCARDCMIDVRYCKVCQSEIDKSGIPANGTVKERLACEVMEFKDPKGRKPVSYRKMMSKLKISREEVETEAGKLNILIDEIHFVEEEMKIKEKKVKEKKVVLVTKEDDLIAQLMDEYEESETSTVIMSDDEVEVEVEEHTLRSDKEVEDKVLVEEKKDKKIAEEKALRSEKEAELALKKQKMAEEKALKEQKIAEEKAKKEQKMAEEKALKEQKMAEEKALRSEKEQKIAEEKAKKEQKMAEEKALKEQKMAQEKAAKEQKMAEEKALMEQKKEQKIAEKAAEVALKKQQQEEEKALKKQQQEAEKALKKQQQEAEKAPKESKEKEPKEKKQKEGTRSIVATKANFKVGDKVKHNEKGVETIATVTEVKMGKSFVEYELRVDDETVFVAPEGNIMVFKEAESAAPAKKVTVKRITIEGKQYLKTAANLLYDPETKEEMGIYDPATNTIKALPDDSEDELSEDEYDNEA